MSYYNSKEEYIRIKQDRMLNPQTFAEHFWNDIQLEPSLVPECRNHKNYEYNSITNEVHILCTPHCFWREWFDIIIKKIYPSAIIVYKKRR